MATRRIIDLTEADLEAIIDRRLDAAIAELRAAPASALDDIGTLSKALCISPKTLQRLRTEPLFPELRLLDSPRFDRAEVIAWIRARNGGQGLRVVGGGK